MKIDNKGLKFSHVLKCIPISLLYPGEKNENNPPSDFDIKITLQWWYCEHGCTYYVYSVLQGLQVYLPEGKSCQVRQDQTIILQCFDNLRGSS